MYQGKFEAKNRPAAQPGYVPEPEVRQAYKPHQSAANAARQLLNIFYT